MPQPRLVDTVNQTYSILVDSVNQRLLSSGMSPPKKRSKPKNARYPGDLRRALLDAALTAVAEDQGAGVLTLRGIARSVGVSHAAPHRHFADKKALLAAVGEEGLRDLR